VTTMLSWLLCPFYNMVSFFPNRTSEVKSAHEVHKVSLGVLALSRALEAGQPIGPHLQVRIIPTPATFKPLSGSAACKSDIS